MVYSFYFLLVGSRRNEANSLWEGRGERSEDYCYPESMPARHFTCSHITFAMVILFIFCLLAPEGMKPIVFGEIKEENQKSTTCSKGVPSRRKMMIYRHNIVVNLSYTTIAGDIILSA